MNSIIINNTIIVDGKAIPPCPSRAERSNITIINEKIYANGYEYKHGKWKRTLKALFHDWF